MAARLAAAFARTCAVPIAATRRRVSLVAAASPFSPLEASNHAGEPQVGQNFGGLHGAACRAPYPLMISSTVPTSGLAQRQRESQARPHRWHRQR